MTTSDVLSGFLFRSLMFESDSGRFRAAGVRVGSDERLTAGQLLDESMAIFPMALRNDALNMSRLYAQLFCFENSVRDLIRNRLSESDPNWWANCVQPKIRANAESRFKQAEDNAWLDSTAIDLIEFVDFGDLAQLVINNWTQFEDLVPSQHWLKQRFEELEGVRNYIAHHRRLAASEYRRMEMYIHDWNRQVGF